jgi:hypothetical protein
MALATLDWAIVIGYLAIAFAVGGLLSRRAHSSTS